MPCHALLFVGVVKCILTALYSTSSKHLLCIKLSYLWVLVLLYTTTINYLSDLLTSHPTMQLIPFIVIVSLVFQFIMCFCFI